MTIYFRNKPISLTWILPLAFGFNVANAQTAEERFVKQSLLVVSAFQCAIVATDAKRQERLFMLGLKSGRDFIEVARNKPELYNKVRGDIPMLWTMNAGPTADIILGQIYAQLGDDIYKKMHPSGDEKLWKMTKENMYREKNCELLS